MNTVVILLAAAALAAAVIVYTQLTRANAQLQSMGERIARLDEVTRNVQRVGESISGLEQLLASPKLRGGLGEWTLESLLQEVLPQDHIMKQQRLPMRGVIVDVAVRTGDGRIIAIDSKFPLDAFRRILQAEAANGDSSRFQAEFARAVRDRIDEVSSKYISPEDGTLDFALMYVPSESIYYEIAVRDRGAELLEYARSERVVICSPNTLYAYLQSVMMGIRGFQIAGRVEEIQIALEHLRQDFAEARMRFDRAGDQLRNAVTNVDGARMTLRELEDRLDRISDKQVTINVEAHL
jgi:DNA recombination protein RmuC